MRCTKKISSTCLYTGLFIFWAGSIWLLQSHLLHEAQNELLGLSQVTSKKTDMKTAISKKPSMPLHVQQEETESTNATFWGPNSTSQEKKDLKKLREPSSEKKMRQINYWRPNPTNYNNKTLMCAIVKGEEAYIDKWVEYHYALGFDHFHIYDNSEMWEMRLWGEKKGDHITVTHWPDQASQRKAYVDCAKRAVLTDYLINNVTYTWAAFFDVDEFLLLRKHEDLHDFLEEHLQRGALGINWLLVRPVEDDLLYSPLPVTKRFQHRESRGSKMIKSIVKLSDMDTSLSGKLGIHKFQLKDKEEKIHDTRGRYFDGLRNPWGSRHDVASLYHFSTKSFKENLVKRLKGDSAYAYKPEDDPKLKEAKEKFDEAFSNPQLRPGGLKHDGALWEAMKKYVPKYAAFDQW